MVVDAGTIIHPDRAAAQAEGALLWGLGMALHEGSEFVNGHAKDQNMETYRLLRMPDVPEVEVEFLPSTEAPVGLGEPATTAVAPAIGNAIFAATGARVRHTPIRPEVVLAALTHGSSPIRASSASRWGSAEQAEAIDLDVSSLISSKEKGES